MGYVSNPIFSGGFNNWTTSINCLNNATLNCDPQPSGCPYYSSCPWADEDLDGPVWYLNSTFSGEGTQYAAVFLEKGKASAFIQSDTFILASGSYKIEAKMWKEDNFTDNMKAQVLNSGGTIVAQTSSFSASYGQQESGGRTWTERYATFEVLASGMYYVRGVVSTVKSPITDVGTPCFDDGHAAFDKIDVVDN